MARRALLLLICLAAFSALASPLPSLHRIREDERWSEYEIALDEVHEARQVRGIPAERDADAVRARLRGNAAADLILYPKGGPRDETTRRFLTRDIAVQVQPGIDPKPMVGAAGG